MYKIENEKQYLRTVELLKQFKEQVEKLNKESENISPRNQLFSASYLSQIEEFKLQLEEFESSIKS